MQQSRGRIMQLYYFVLKTGRQSIPDTEGQELLDEGGAPAHALAVAQQLMRNRALACVSWRIEVCDDYLRPLFDVYFADAVDSAESPPLQLQAFIQRVARSVATFNEALTDARATLADVRQTLARANAILDSVGGARL